MGESNGKWAIAFWLMTVLLLGSFTWSTWGFFRNSDKIETLAKTANHSLTTIDLRLSRIEWKLGIR